MMHVAKYILAKYVLIFGVLSVATQVHGVVLGHSTASHALDWHHRALATRRRRP